MPLTARDLSDELARLAHSPVLLVATDYDGTLAPIVADPREAFPHREAIVALRSLAALPQTHVAVISGRGLSELARLSGAQEDFRLVGSHGSEFDPGFAASLSDAACRLRESIVAELDSIAGRDPGFTVETKPAGAAFHYRNADRELASWALERIESGPAALDGVSIRVGKMVVELSVVPTDKGSALARIRAQVGASAVLFLGDDSTDESAFATLAGPDVGVKVGDGETRAAHRVGGTEAVARLLAALTEERAAWVSGSTAAPIETLSFLSDQRSVVLVAPGARVVWAAMPSVDSSPLFAELLGGPAAGRFSIQPADGSDAVRTEYVSGSLVVETRFRNLTVTDYLSCSAARVMQRPGRSDLLRVVEGTGRVRIEYAPRMDYGRSVTRLAVRDCGIEILGSLDPIVLWSPGVSWSIVDEGIHHTALAEVDLDEAPVILELRYGSGNLHEELVPERERRARTLRHWCSWSEQLVLPRVRPELVRRSALVLSGLTHGPTGAIAAAATTSLPEQLGGVRNWDYRYAWLRDAALAAEALVLLGSRVEAIRFLDWVMGIVDSLPGPENLRPLYAVNGQPLGPEAEIAGLSGYAGSRPVRVGNAAGSQLQLDVYGPIVNLVHLLFESGAPVSGEHWRLVEAFVRAVGLRWAEPDHGIWEVRTGRRHFVHSKVMCWISVDRGIRIADRFLGRKMPEWEELRAAIATDILARGWCEGVGAFTASYGCADLDAAALWVGLSGLVEASDPRFVATVEAVERELRDGPTVFRYRYDDGLPGSDGGGFHFCTSWLVDALVLVGRAGDARELFDELCALVGPTGLLSEEYDPRSGRALGNHPQAYSHIGIVKNALSLSRA